MSETIKYVSSDRSEHTKRYDIVDMCICESFQSRFGTVVDFSFSVEAFVKKGCPMIYFSITGMMSLF